VTNRLRALFIAAALIPITVACVSNSSTSGSAVTSTASGPRPSSTGKLSIVSPTTGKVLPAGNVTLKVKLTGATIVAASSTHLVPDQGHLHVILDDNLITMTGSTTTILPNLAAGTHLLKVEFVANDHAPFDPRVIAATSFKVK
jgi:hypothetical protein